MLLCLNTTRLVADEQASQATTPAEKNTLASQNWIQTPRHRRRSSIPVLLPQAPCKTSMSAVPSTSRLSNRSSKGTETVSSVMAAQQDTKISKLVPAFLSTTPPSTPPASAFARFLPESMTGDILSSGLTDGLPPLVVNATPANESVIRSTESLQPIASSSLQEPDILLALVQSMQTNIEYMVSKNESLESVLNQEQASRISLQLEVKGLEKRIKMLEKDLVRSSSSTVRDDSSIKNVIDSSISMLNDAPIADGEETGHLEPNNHQRPVRLNDSMLGSGLVAIESPRSEVSTCLTSLIPNSPVNAASTSVSGMKCGQ